jgi:cation transport ATPase
VGLLRSLFSPKDIGEVARSAVRGLDDLVYTEQEKAEKTQEAQRLYSELYMAALPSALARRIIAVLVVLVWCTMMLFATAIHGFDPKWSEQTLKILQEMVVQPVNIILGFYFLQAVVKTYRKSE